MKKIGFFIALVLSVLLVLVAYGPSDNAVEIAQAQGVIEAARAAQDAARAAQIATQGLSDVGRGQTLILVLLTLVVVPAFYRALFGRDRPAGGRPGVQLAAAVAVLAMLVLPPRGWAQGRTLTLEEALHLGAARPAAAKASKTSKTSAKKAPAAKAKKKPARKG